MNAQQKCLTLLALIGSTILSPGQDKNAAPSAEKPKAAPVASSGETSKPNQEALEEKFKATLAKATMAGRWCLIKDGVLTPEKEDRYTIIEAKKLDGDRWVISARIQYNKQDIVAPIPVQVKWAGDTPVIIVDKLPIPGGGVYSARVLIYEQTYAGTWTGKDHRGLLNGSITYEGDKKPAETKSPAEAK